MTEILYWGYPGLFICGFLAGCIIPMNIEGPLCAAVALGWPAWYCLFWAWLGDWLGAVSNYFLGMLASPEWIIKHCHVKREKLERVQAYMQGKGVWFACANFIPTVGNVTIICMGAARASLWKVSAILAVCVFIRLLLVMLLTTGVISFFS